MRQSVYGQVGLKTAESERFETTMRLEQVGGLVELGPEGLRRCEEVAHRSVKGACQRTLAPLLRDWSWKNPLWGRPWVEVEATQGRPGCLQAAVA